MKKQMVADRFVASLLTAALVLTSTPAAGIAEELDDAQEITLEATDDADPEEEALDLEDIQGVEDDSLQDLDVADEFEEDVALEADTVDEDELQLDEDIVVSPSTDELEAEGEEVTASDEDASLELTNAGDPAHVSVTSQEAEPNDSLYTANTIKFNTNVQGIYNSYADQDFYMVDVPSAGTYAFSFAALDTSDPAPLAYRIRVYDYDYNCVLTDYRGSDDPARSYWSVELPKGVAYIQITGTGFLAVGSIYTLRLDKTNISTAKVALAKTTFTYTGTAITPNAVITLNGTALKKNVDYTLSYTNNLKVGKATVTITGKGAYTGSKKLSFTIAKKANTLKVTKQKSQLSVAYSSTRTRTTAVNLTVTGAKGKVTYTNVSTNTTAKKFTVNKTTGKVTVPKKTKAGTYTVKVKATAAGSAIYKSASKTISYKIKVNKLANPLTVKRAVSTYWLSYDSYHKNFMTSVYRSKYAKVSKAKGTLTYSNVSTGSVSKNFFIDSKTGKLYIWSGVDKGTYTVKVRITAAGNATYKAATKYVTFKVKLA